MNATKEDPIGNHATNAAPKHQQQPTGNLYSSIVGSFQNQNGADARNSRGDNPFKYSKGEMLQVYNNLVENDKMHAPLDFERYDEVTSQTPVQPVNMTEPSEDEKKVLSGNVNSDIKPRRADQTDLRQNGRRDGNRNGGRDGRKHDNRRSGDATAISNGRSSQSAINTNADAQGNEIPESARDTFSHLSGRNTSRLATMGVFDTAAPSTDQDNGRWKAEKDNDEVYRDNSKYNDTGASVDRLSEMFTNQSLGGHAQPQAQAHQLHSRMYGEQTAYNPLSNGLPDLLAKSQPSSAMYGAIPQQSSARPGFLGNTPSPGSQMRHDQPPPVAPRIMVMPDKLKWQYRDPTGQNQGPFSGLEMHDWYKAGFFQPNLLVKREEDEEFEPLSILVRRIGNQREPFLVPLPSRASTAPQAGKAGSADTPETWPNGSNWSGSGASAGGASGGQPPFPQSFPSFGTTLTAEQQNALERRKQEEQYLMHRQREFLQQQQMAHQRFHPSGQYGGAQQQQYGYGTDRRSSPFSSSERQGSGPSYDPSAAPAAGWSGYNPQSQNPARGQYTDFGAGIFDIPKSEVSDQTYREPKEIRQESFAKPSSFIGKPVQVAQQRQQPFDKSIEAQSTLAELAEPSSAASASWSTSKSSRPTVVEQVTSPIAAIAPSALVVDHPIEPSEEALPASPVAAPWAAAALAKGKSLKEIQELEAERAEQRRLAAARQKVIPSTVEEPASVSVSHLANFLERETRAEAVLPSGPAWKASNTPGKKTLAQIQLEEETARRALLQAQTNAVNRAGATQQNAVLGTRYADTASRSGTGAAWSTVGSSGRVTSPHITTKSEPRVQVPVAGTVTSAPAKGVVQQQQTQSRASVNPDAISLDFFQWAQSALKGLNPGVNFAEFLQLLLSFGTDGGKDTREIISDSIYANSATLDGRRFADEFCKRRREDLKNKDGQNKSISELTSNLPSSSGTNGWSDVVKTKKSEAEDEQWNSSFKVQSKGGKRRK